MSVIKGKLALPHNLKQETKFGKDLKYKDLVTNKEALRIIAENIDKLMAETGSYRYVDFQANQATDGNLLGNIQKKEMTVEMLEQERKKNTGAEQIKCEGIIFQVIQNA